MNSDESSPVIQPASPAASHRVSLSPYVNEPLPNWEELLSARDVARLALLGRLPRKQRYHGRNIGWLRSDVLTWLSRDLRVVGGHTSPAVNARSYSSRQRLLPLGFAGRAYTARRDLRNCMGLGNRSRRRRARRSRTPDSRES
jgi:hypothetical protein